MDPCAYAQGWIRAAPFGAGIGKAVVLNVECRTFSRGQKCTRSAFNFQRFRLRRDDEVDAAVVVALQDVFPQFDGGGLVDAAIDLADVAVSPMNRIGPL